MLIKAFLVSLAVLGNGTSKTMRFGREHTIFRMALRVCGYFRSSLLLRALGVFAVFWALFSFYFFLGTFTALDDQFFNIKVAEMLRERGFSVFRQFDWFAFTLPYPWISNLLFYTSLVPFTFVTPLELGIKLYATVALAFTFAVLYFFLVTVRVRHAFFSVLAVAGLLLAWPILWHLLMARAFVVLPALLLLEIALFVRGRYGAAGFVSFVYFFWHTGTFFFPFLVAGIFFLFASQAKGKPDMRPLVSAFLGVAVAIGFSFLLIPGFADAFAYTFGTVVKIVAETGLSTRVAIDEGSEVYPTNVFNLYGEFPILIVLLAVFSVTEAVRFARQLFRKNGEPVSADAVGGTLFLLSIIFLLGSFVTKRMVDFFVIFSSVFVVYVLSVFLKGLSWKPTRPMVAGAMLALLIGLASNILLLSDKIASQRHYALIRGAAEWLRDNTEEKEIIFNPTINLFSTFFFFNGGHNRFIVGLEPRNLFEYDREKYWLWYNVSSRGVVCGRETCAQELQALDVGLRLDSDRWYRENGSTVARMIRENFSTRYVIVTKEFERLGTLLEKSESFEKVYETPGTAFFAVYRIREH